MRPTCFALLVKNFFIRVVGGSNKAGLRITLLLLFVIMTCTRSVARSTIIEVLLSRSFRRGSRSNHTPKPILWLGPISSIPIAQRFSALALMRLRDRDA